MKIRRRRLGRRNIWEFLLAICIIGLVFACSIDILDIDQPEEIDAGETLTAIIHAQIDPAGDNDGSTLVVGFLAPKSWNAQQNTVAFYDCPALSANNEPMQLMQPSILEDKSSLPWKEALKQDSRYGLMGNLIDDMEWIVFRSIKTYDVSNKVNFDVTINAKVGKENMFVHLGYFVGNMNDGLAAPGDDKYHDGKFRELTVNSGEGDLIDFVNPQIASMELAKATDNDIQTIYYDGDLTPTILTDETEVFLCATGYTEDGETIEKCEATDNNRLKKDVGVNRYRFDFWPRRFFGLNENQKLSKIEYFIMDATGTKKIGYGGSISPDEPFKFTFGCK